VLRERVVVDLSATLTPDRIRTVFLFEHHDLFQLHLLDDTWRAVEENYIWIVAFRAGIKTIIVKLVNVRFRK